MNDDGLTESIVSKIAEHSGMARDEIRMDTELGELGIHSLELTEIIFDIEEEHHIEIEMNTVEAWNNLKNVGDIVSAVGRLVNGRAPGQASPA